MAGVLGQVYWMDGADWPNLSLAYYVLSYQSYPRVLQADVPSTHLSLSGMLAAACVAASLSGSGTGASDAGGSCDCRGPDVASSWKMHLRPFVVVCAQERQRKGGRERQAQGLLKVSRMGGLSGLSFTAHQPCMSPGSLSPAGCTGSAIGWG